MARKKDEEDEYKPRRWMQKPSASKSAPTSNVVFNFTKPEHGKEYGPEHSISRIADKLNSMLDKPTGNK